VYEAKRYESTKFIQPSYESIYYKMKFDLIKLSFAKEFEEKLSDL